MVRSLACFGSWLLVTSAVAGVALAGPADDVQGSWVGTGAELTLPPPAAAPSQAEADAWVQGLALDVDSGSLTLRSDAGERIESYQVVSEDGSALTVETALGRPVGATALRSLTIDLDGGALRLRVHEGDGFTAVFAPAP